MPYIYIDSLPKLDQMREGFFLADEFWQWIDTMDRSKRARTIANILLRSRKRGLTYCFTNQTLGQLKTRIRQVCDFTAIPILNAKETVCKVMIFRTGYPSISNYMKTFYFKPTLIMQMYNHREEVEMIKEDGDDDMSFTWQENAETEPKMFETFEEADKFAEDYWTTRAREIKMI
jgi:hypothetical protein